MSSDDIAISINSLSKCYEIYEAPGDRLKQFLLPRFRRAVGRSNKDYYSEFWALKNVSFTVKKGESVGILGRNGKSTLLQMICGTLSPTSGGVIVHGRVAALLELGSGFNPEFSGRDNIYMYASVLGLSGEEVDARLDDILDFADIGMFIEQPVKTYSSGMVVRLAFAVIAHVDADILVVDEALAVGDAFFTQKCMRFLREFMERGTILFVSHDTSAIINLCSKAVLLDHGEVLQVGSPKDVTDRYLSSLYEATQDISGVATVEDDSIGEQVFDTVEYRDAREDLIDGSCLRNDIEVFRFLGCWSGKCCLADSVCCRC
jgi:lipopolysaccharide transport system ATP-binding protein